LLEIMRTRRVGKYEIIGEIGHGGMATVYRARDTRLDRLVALKVMHPHLQGAKEARTRFAREAVTIARLKHPNILEIYDYSGEDGDTHYIATELLTGPTLKQLVDQHPDMPAEIAACVAILIARALGAAHAEGVIHRDVKPENVMMHENRAVKLTDFGIAQLVDMQGMTTTGQVLGSPAHMAPEQIEGRDCDARSDIFSLGTVLYLLATGELPFQGRNAHQVLKQIAEGQFRDPLLVKPQIGGRLRSVILRCLHVDPALRYATAQEVEKDLMEFVRAAGIEDPSEVIARYLKGTRAFSQAFRATIIEAEILLGEAAMKNGEVPRAIDAFNRVLAIDEHNERVLNQLKRLGHRQRLRRLGLWSAGALVILSGAAFFVHAINMRAKTGTVGEPATVATKSVGVAPPTLSPPTAARPLEPSATVVATKPASPPTLPLPAAATSPEHKALAPKASAAKAEESAAAAAPPVDPHTPRHVVLRPEPANVSISIDRGGARDFGPSFRDVTLPPGRHEFQFLGAHDCCVNETISVDIPAGLGSYVLSHRLHFRPAMLFVASNTPANVVVDDGAVRGRTWSVIQVPQPNDMNATHVIRVTTDGHRPFVHEVRLRAGQLERVDIKLEPNSDAVPPG
jgi:hypothetical protein